MLALLLAKAGHKKEDTYSSLPGTYVGLVGTNSTWPSPSELPWCSSAHLSLRCQEVTRGGIAVPWLFSALVAAAWLCSFSIPFLRGLLIASRALRWLCVGPHCFLPLCFSFGLSVTWHNLILDMCGRSCIWTALGILIPFQHHPLGGRGWEAMD